MSQMLSGLRVLAIDQVVSGPYGSMLLADNGAEVIKIERPGTGEIGRGMRTHRVGDTMLSSVIIGHNRNKKGIALDLKSEEGRAIFLRLVEKSDVVWENFSAGTMEQLALSYAELAAVNPRVIMVSISGFGKLGPEPLPYDGWPAYDNVIQGMSGLMNLPGKAGDPPLWLGTQLADIYAGVMGVTGLMMALYERNTTGVGRQVDVSMYEAATTLALTHWADHAVYGRSYERSDRATGQLGVIRSRDGHLTVGIVTDRSWKRFAEATGRPELGEREDVATTLARRDHKDAVRELFEAWTTEHTRDEGVSLLRDCDIPVGPVQSLDEVLNSPHLEGRGFWDTVEVPGAGAFKLPGNPFRVDGPPTVSTPPPGIGQHSDEVLSSLLGLSAAELDRLRDLGAVQ